MFRWFWNFAEKHPFIASLLLAWAIAIPLALAINYLLGLL